MDANIVLISENNELLRSLRKNFHLRRNFDVINILPPSKIRNIPKNANIVLISDREYSKMDILKLSKQILKTASHSRIILLNHIEDSDFVLELFNSGIYDYIDLNNEKVDSFIRIKNLLRLLKAERAEEILTCFLDISNSINYNYNLFSRKALKYAFEDLDERDYIRNGIFCTLTFDENTRTKTLLNKLVNILKKRLRSTDICACGNEKLYVIFPDTTPEGAKLIIEEISNLMGADSKLRTGICKIAINEFETIERLSNNALQSAIINDNICVYQDSNSDRPFKGNYKIFQKSYENKLERVIKPLFFRFETDTNISNAEIIHYEKEQESVLCIKNNKLKSALTIRYNGLAKLDLTLSHSGLNTPETTNTEIPLNKFSDKDLTKYLKQLLKEFKEGAKNA